MTLLRKAPGQPHRLGFDLYCLFGWHEGPRYWQPLIWQDGKVRTDVADRYGPDVYCQFLIDFMERNRDRPFFAFYSMALCHDVRDDLAEPVPFGPRGRYDNFYEMLAALDERVGRIVEAVDRLGLSGKTVILFTADNGSPSSQIITAKGKDLIRAPVWLRVDGRQLRGGKGKLTDGGTRVPLLISWPGRVKPNQVLDCLVDSSDFLPTLAELAGVEVPPHWQIDGVSFLPSRTGRPGKRRQWAFAEHRGRCWVHTQRWKLYDDGRFFDLQADPEEKMALSRTQQAPEASEAPRRLRDALKRLGWPTAQ